MKNPKISIIMSVYDSEKHLDESIQSILNQTFRDFEFIIVNDCSTDDSLHIIDEHAKQDDRIILIDNKMNVGLTKSLNLGLKEAKGKYIARIDADDVAMPNRLEIQYNYLENNRNIFLVGSGALKIDKNGNSINTHKRITNPIKVKQKLVQENCIYHPTILFRNEANNFYREHFVYSQDYDFYLMLVSNGKILINIQDVLIKYRINPNAISLTMASKQKYFALKANEFYHQRLKYGKDEYDKFDPNDILSIDVENSIDKFSLMSEIEAKFKLNEFEEVRLLCVKYFSQYGFLNTVVIYYLLSYTGKRFVNIIRTIIFR